MTAAGLNFGPFHADDYTAGRGSVSPEQLAEAITQIDRHSMLSARQFLQRARTGRLRPSDTCLTFDGGDWSQYDLALPVLEEFGLTAFWFIDGIGRRNGPHLAPTCLQQLARDGHLVGPRFVSPRDPHAGMADLAARLSRLRDLLHDPVAAFSHAHLVVNAGTMAQVVGLGLRLGFRSNAVESRTYTPLDLPREDAGDWLARRRAMVSVQ